MVKKTANIDNSMITAFPINIETNEQKKEQNFDWSLNINK